MITHIRHTEVKDFSHRQTLGGANCCAEPAEATFAHVNIKLGGINSFWRSIGGLANFFNGSNRFNVNAIYRANLCTLVADNAIINFVVQSVATIVGHRLHLVWVLNGGNALAFGKVVFIGDGNDWLCLSGFDEMPERKV
jgi:hypothetical protein